MGLFTVGVGPGWEEVGRLVVYLVVSFAYVSFWLGLALLFSILFRPLATSALAAVALWIFSLLHRVCLRPGGRCAGAGEESAGLGGKK